MSGLRPIDLDQGNSMQDSIRQVLIKNFTSLGLVQVTNYLLPLLVVPFLIRKIGIELFGLVSFAQAMVAYYNVVVDYGFNLTITQKIALQKNNPASRVEKSADGFTNGIPSIARGRNRLDLQPIRLQ